MHWHWHFSSTKATSVSQGILQQFGNASHPHGHGPANGATRRVPRAHRSNSSEVNPVAILAYGTPQQQLQMLGGAGMAVERGPRRIRSDGSLAQERRSGADHR